MLIPLKWWKIKWKCKVKILQRWKTLCGHFFLHASFPKQHYRQITPNCCPQNSKLTQRSIIPSVMASLVEYLLVITKTNQSRWNVSAAVGFSVHTATSSSCHVVLCPATSTGRTALLLESPSTCHGLRPVPVSTMQTGAKCIPCVRKHQAGPATLCSGTNAKWKQRAPCSQIIKSSFTSS